jgi:hypothetical protein
MRSQLGLACKAAELRLGETCEVFLKEHCGKFQPDSAVENYSFENQWIPATFN